MASRRGFTLVEVMVAVLILTVGLLGLVGTSAAVTRLVAKGGRQSLVASVARTRFEGLRSVDCTSLSNGWAVGYNGISESWSVRRVARAVIVVDSVRYQDRGLSRSQTFETVIPCPALP
jgi:prepilin-type N-terminal cleavage/methylation domain-containing protein